MKKITEEIWVALTSEEFNPRPIDENQLGVLDRVIYDEITEEPCVADKEFICTRAAGHPGPHIAHGRKHAVAIWKQEKEV